MIGINSSKIVRNTKKILSMVLILSLVTYYTHGFFNNFLDTDKASAPFWGFTAMLVAMDIYYIRKGKEEDRSDGEIKKIS